MVQQLMTQEDQDERYLFIAFLIISQMGEYLKNCSEISPIIPPIVAKCSFQSPSLRYSCYHCFGQLSIDLGPQFQIMFGDTVLPTLVVGIRDKVYFNNNRF